MYFSVVIPLYNKQNSIAATLQSVLAQTYTNYEIIVVDDGSTDDSARIAEEYIREVKGAENCEAETTASRLSPLAFRLIKKNNGGVCSARNRGIQEAKYDYVALLDGDDLWDEHYLEEQVKLIQDFPEARMWGINFAEMSNGKLIRKLPTGLPDDYRGYVENYFQMPGRISDLFCSSSVVISKEVFDRVGYFDERIKYAEDNDMWFRIIARNQVVFYDRYMAFYQFDAENRALNKPIVLKYFLPYYVDKFRDFKDNQVFYTWINRWTANHIRKYYFEEMAGQREDAKVAIKKLDYSVIPTKYRFLYGMPYPIACLLNKLDKWYHKR
jgi:glycosyltransferase involved in cell wall biosynthesis